MTVQQRETENLLYKVSEALTLQANRYMGYAAILSNCGREDEGDAMEEAALVLAQLSGELRARG